MNSTPSPAWPPPSGLPPHWSPPPGLPSFVPRRQVRPERRRLGWVLIGVGAVVVAVAVLTAGRDMWRLFAGHADTRVPGTVTVACREGAEWRVGPVTGSSDRYGPITVTTSTGPRPIDVTVEMNGTRIPVSPMRGASETFSYFGTTYTATGGFTCPGNGSATITFDGPSGIGAGAFPAFWEVFRALLWLMAGAALALACVVPGIVLAVRHRRSLQQL
jgi:hypothetical protein